MLNRIGCGVSALLNDFELKIKSVPCWWSIDRIEWFVWSNHLMIHLIIIASFDRIIWSHYLIASFDRTGWGGQGGSKMHVETISFQSQTHHSTSMVIVVPLIVIIVACNAMVYDCLVWPACLMPRSSLPCWVGEGYQNWEQLPVSKFCNGFARAVYLP